MIMTIAIGSKTEGTIIAALELAEPGSLTVFFRVVGVGDVVEVEPDVGSAPKMRNFYKSINRKKFWV